jgi:ATP-dependent DNA helicase RecQ
VAEAEDCPPHEQVVEQAARVEERRREFGRSRVEMMRGYAETTGCRRAFVLSYFGEPFEPPCGNCDNCDRGRGEASAEGPFPLGGRVVHDEWGGGVVQRYEEGAVVVLFDDVGYRKLSLEVVLERGLLEAG